MFQQFFVNFTILIAAVSITAHAFREKELNKSSPLSRKVFFGVWAGFLGIILMLFTIQVVPTVIIDFRNVVTIWSAIYGGPISALVSGILICSFRILYFGLTQSSIMGCVNIILLVIGCSIICRFTTKVGKKHFICTILNLILSCSAFFILIKNKEILGSVLITYTIGVIIVSYFMFFITEFHIKTNMLYRSFKSQSQKDFLTGLNNVRVFDKEWNAALQEVKEKDLTISLLILDIDFFKKINDNYGHIEGDRVLKDLSLLFQKACRDNDIVSRNGGEEFSIILRNCPLKEAIEVSERIRTTVEDYPFKLSGDQVINITISIGVANYPETIIDIDKLTEQADAALYKAKRTGRNKVAIIENNEI